MVQLNNGSIHELNQVDDLVHLADWDTVIRLHLVVKTKVYGIMPLIDYEQIWTDMQIIDCEQAWTRMQVIDYEQTCTEMHMPIDEFMIGLSPFEEMHEIEAVIFNLSDIQNTHTDGIQHEHSDNLFLSGVFDYTQFDSGNRFA